MWNLLLIFGCLIVMIGLLFRFLDDAWIPDSKKAALRERFENWWLAVACADIRTLALALAHKTAQATDFYFGPRLISKRAFLRSFVISTSLLGLLLGLMGIRTGRPLGLAPWQRFEETVTRFDKIWSAQKKNAKPADQMTDTEKQLQQSQQTLEAVVRQYSTSGWKITYSVTSLVALTGLNSVFFFSALIYSRMILKEIIAAARVFSTVTLLLANFALAGPTWILVFLLEMVIFTPWLWLGLPAVYYLSKVSLYWLAAFISGGSIIGLAFGSSLISVSLLGFLPCVLALMVTALSGLILLNRNLFHKLAIAVLLRCAEKGPLKVGAALMILLGGSLAALIQLLRYWR